MVNALAIILIVGVIGIIIYVFYELHYSVKLKLQTINFYQGGLGSGKTTTGSNTGVKLRNRSVFSYTLFNKYYYVTHSIIILAMLLLISKTRGYILLALFGLLILYLCLVLFVWRKKRTNFFIREVYTNYPLFLYSVRVWKKRHETEEQFLERVHKKYPLDYCYLKPKKPKSKSIKIKVFSKALKKGHLLGTLALPGGCIIILDEVSQIFPNENKKSDLIVEEAFRWFRHHTTFKMNEDGTLDRDSRTFSGTIILMDQSIGSCNISIRRRVNLVYNLSSFRKFLFFYKIDVDRIKYAEDVIVNTNDINNFECYHLWGIFGRRRFDSCYHRMFYKPDKSFESMWENYQINPLSKNVNAVEQGFIGIKK